MVQKSGAGNHECRKWAWAVMSVVTFLLKNRVPTNRHFISPDNTIILLGVLKHRVSIIVIVKIHRTDGEPCMPQVIKYDIVLLLLSRGGR